MNKKVLFIAGGRRIELMRKFHENGYEVFSYEYDERAPIRNYIGEQHFFPAPPWGDDRAGKKRVLDDLSLIMDSYQISFAICLTDEAGKEVICEKKIYPEYHALRVVGDFYSALICYDKRTMDEFFNWADIKKYYPYPVTYPQVDKPAGGYGSKDIQMVYSPTYQAPDRVRQQFIEGDEYTVDAYFSKEGILVDCVPRKRLLVANGEVLESVTLENAELASATKKIGEELAIRGPACMQFIIEKCTGRPYFIECNTRFGGGSTISIGAGFNIIDLLTQEYVLKKPLQYTRTWTPNFLGRRTYSDTYFTLQEEVAHSL